MPETRFRLLEGYILSGQMPIGMIVELFDKDERFRAWFEKRREADNERRI